MAGGHREGPDHVGSTCRGPAGRGGREKIGGRETRAGPIFLLPEGRDPGQWRFIRTFRAPDEDVVVLSGGGEEPVNGLGPERPLPGEPLQPAKRVPVEFTGFGPGVFALENRGKGAAELPGMEERSPVHVGDECADGYVPKHPGTPERGCDPF